MQEKNISNKVTIMSHSSQALSHKSQKFKMESHFSCMMETCLMEY